MQSRRGGFLVDVAVGLSYLTTVALSVGGCVAFFLALDFDPVITIVLSFPIGLVLGLTLLFLAMKLVLLLKPKPAPAGAETAVESHDVTAVDPPPGPKS